MRRLITALALLGILAIAQGCGGGSDSGTTAATGGDETSAAAPQGGTSTTASDGGGKSSTPGEDNGGGQGGDDNSAAGGGGPEGPGLEEKAKPDTKGFKAPPGGDDSIQTFGDEPESTEEDEIVAAMGSFLRSLAARDYPAICNGLSEANRSQLEQLAKLKKELGSDCPSILEKLLVGPTDEPRKAAEGTVYQVRVEGENAFILFTPLGGTASYFVMKHDPDGWKSTSVGAGVPFDPGA